MTEQIDAGGYSGPDRRQSDRREGYDGPDRRQRELFDRRERWVIRIVLVLIAGVTIWTAQENRQRTREGRQAHDALCVYKQDLQRRVASTADYLRTHPNGVPSLGLSAAALQQSLTNQISAIRSLDSLRCDPATPPPVTVTNPASSHSTTNP